MESDTRIRKICESYVTALFENDESMGSFQDIVNKFVECSTLCVNDILNSMKTE